MVESSIVVGMATDPSHTTEDFTGTIETGTWATDSPLPRYIPRVMPILNKVIDIYSYFCCVVPWMAIVCNSISIAVFANKVAKKKTQSVNILLIALAVTDTLSLLVSMDYAVFFATDYEYSFMQKTSFGCQGIKYIDSVARVCSTYIVLAFTVDRYISVAYPLKRSLWVTTGRVLFVLMAIVIFAIGLESYIPVYTNYNSVNDLCYVKRPDKQNLLIATNRYGVGLFLPAAIVAVFNCLIVKKLAQWRRQRSALTAKESKAQTDGQNHSLTILLVVVSTFSFVVSFPKAVMNAYTVTKPPQTEAYWVAYYVTDALAMLNYSCNFFFYCLSGSQFRGDLKKMFWRMIYCSGDERSSRGLQTSYATRSTIALDTTRAGMSTSAISVNTIATTAST